MKNIESRVTKLEKLKGSNQEEIIAILDGENLNVLERTKILYEAGIITGEIIAGWIKQGVKNNGT